MTEWKVVKLGDVADIIGGGTPDTKNDSYWGGDVPWLTPKDLSGYGSRYISKGERNISYQGLENSSAKMLPAGSVLLTSRAPIGYVAIAKTPLCTNQGFKSLILKEDANSEFFYYLLKNNVDYIQGMSSGSTFAEISGSQVKALEFKIPPLDVQKRIAGILGALDDKIEVLREQNKTLEKMAQAVFQSWFVDCDIVRAKAAGLPAADVCKKYHITPDIYDLFPSTFSADNLPLGWEKKKLGDMVCNVKENIKAGRETIIKPYVPIDCISSKTLTLYESKSGEEAQSSLISFRQKDILFGAMRAYFHKVCIAPYEGTTRSTAFVLRPYKQKDLSFSLLSVFQKNCIDFASMNSKGSTMPYAVWDHCLSDYQTEASSSTIRDAFNNIVEPYLDKLIENSKQIRTLEQTRDTLLPQLISGKLDVENMTVPSVIDEV